MGTSDAILYSDFQDIICICLIFVSILSFISPGMHNSHTYLYPPDASGGYLGLAFAMLL